MSSAHPECSAPSSRIPVARERWQRRAAARRDGDDAPRLTRRQAGRLVVGLSLALWGLIGAALYPLLG